MNFRRELRGTDDLSSARSLIIAYRSCGYVEPERFAAFPAGVNGGVVVTASTA
jgi:hypothetical protein